VTSHASALPKAAPRRTFGKAFGKIVQNEARLAWRSPGGLAAGVGIPVLLVIVFGEVPKFQEQQSSFGGLTTFDAYVPVLIVFGLTLLALWGTPMPLVSYREQGILRRLKTTPASPTWLLAGQAFVNVAIAIASILIVLFVAVLAFGAPAPKNYGGLVLSLALGIGGLFPIGLTIAALAPTSSTASAIGRLTFLPLMFFAGLWLPLPLMPGVLRNISEYTPVGAAVEAIQDSVLGQFPPAAPLLSLVGYAVVFSLLAWRFFRWE
jgi:ABC-2 type transport system permease protein